MENLKVEQIIYVLQPDGKTIKEAEITEINKCSGKQDTKELIALKQT